MSLMVNGQMRDGWQEAETDDGAFVRHDSQFRHWVTADGSPGPSGTGGFKAESGRYHLYVSLACPWAHRTLIFRHLKKLQGLISVSVVHPHMGDKGWQFAAYPGSTADDVNGFDYMYQVYAKAQPDYSGIITVPVLWDKQQQVIVNNESSEIIRMLNTAFDHLTDATLDYYPEPWREEIDRINAFVYEHINNGVYKTGFATEQSVYETSYKRLFKALDEIESILSVNRYLTGGPLSEADWRLFTTLIRFDAVYYGHFKCNARRIQDYPHLSAYLRELYQVPGIAATVDMQQIKQHYYYSHESINPTRIVPLGPEQDFSLAHGRDKQALKCDSV